MKSTFPRFAVFAFAVFASGCIGGSPKVTYLKDRAQVPHFVAILPPDNKTSDSAAPDTVRRASAEMLLGLGMIPVSSPAQDAQIMEVLGEGKPLNEIPPQTLADKLGVDGLLYATITQFHDFNAIVVAEREVAATLKLLDRMGNKVWEIEGTGYNRQFDVNPTDWAMNAGKLATKSVGLDIGGMLEKALHVHLLNETQMMTGFMSPLLPSWPQSDKAGIDLAAELAQKQAAAEAKSAAAKKQ